MALSPNEDDKLELTEPFCKLRNLPYHKHIARAAAISEEELNKLLLLAPKVNVPNMSEHDKDMCALLDILFDRYIIELERTN